MSTHIGDACRAAGLLPIAMAVKCTKLDRSGRARIADFCHRLLGDPFVSVRTSGNPLAALPRLREAVADVNPTAALDDVMTMESRLSSSVLRPQLYAVFVGLFGAIALLLATLGVYGLLSHTVAQSRGEIGIRMALGARRGNVVALVFRQGASLVAAGAGLGLIATRVLARTLDSLLFGVTSEDAATFASSAILLIATALVACWLPARRASRVNPTDALRAG